MAIIFLNYTDNFQNVPKKMQQVAVLPGATHCTDGKYGVTKQNSGCDATIM